MLFNDLRRVVNSLELAGVQCNRVTVGSEGMEFSTNDRGLYLVGRHEFLTHEVLPLPDIDKAAGWTQRLKVNFAK